MKRLALTVGWTIGSLAIIFALYYAGFCIAAASRPLGEGGLRLFFAFRSAMGFCLIGAPFVIYSYFKPEEKVAE